MTTNEAIIMRIIFQGNIWTKYMKKYALQHQSYPYYFSQTQAQYNTDYSNQVGGDV